MKRTFEVNKILIPIDFSETSKMALKHAANLCEKFKSELTLLHVFTPSPADVLPMLDLGSNFDEVKGKVADELNAMGAKFRDEYGVSVSIELRDGTPAKEIVKASKELEVDMIVMGTHGASGFEEFFLGSNANKVVTSSTVPVFSIQKDANKLGYDRIALPIDSSLHTRDKVSEAVLFAKTFGATIHLAALITENHEEEKNKFNLKMKQVEEYLDHQGVKYDSTYKHGSDIADMTMEHAKEVDADVIFIMTEQEAATGLFVGPYAQRVVNHSKIPVVSVTPLETVSSFGQDQLAGDYRPFYI